MNKYYVKYDHLIKSVEKHLVLDSEYKECDQGDDTRTIFMITYDGL